MILKYGLPIASLLLTAFAIYHVAKSYPPPPSGSPPLAPPQPPFAQVLAATGVVEARPANVAVAAPVPGVIVEVPVQVGQSVAAGAPLFRLDDRSLRAELRVREARLANARAQLEKIEHGPRPDEVAASAAQVGAARAQLALQKARLEHAESLLQKRLNSPLEVEPIRQAVAAAEQQLGRALAEDRLLRAGASETERAVARTAVAEAEALVAQGKVECERLTVCAPCAGTVLQVNVRAGEAVGGSAVAPVLLGAVRPLCVRVEIDAEQIGRFHPGAAARAVPRGQPQRDFPLRFLRVEPLVILKRQFTGDGNERSDTRVLQVLYTLDPGEERIYVGQPMDVFIAAGR
jgi:multidrug resistance efflux pump